MHTTTAQNKAHREDLHWIKVGRSEYMRADGVTIRKNQSIGAFWQIFLPTGEVPCMVLSDGEVLRNFQASGHSLTSAKWHAQFIDADTPAYERKPRP